MRVWTLILSLLVTSIVGDEIEVNNLPESTAVSIQAVGIDSPISLLAEIKYDPSILIAEITSYEAPEIAPESKLLRIGVYDAKTKTWKSSTSVTSVESFSKGYAPVITLSLDTQGAVLGVSCKSGKIHAGYTRDFGPKVKVIKTVRGKTPELNRPVALTKEGKVEEVVPEKTLLQKYWMVGLGVLVIIMVTGGGEGK